LAECDHEGDDYSERGGEAALGAAFLVDKSTSAVNRKKWPKFEFLQRLAAHFIHVT